MQRTNKYNVQVTDMQRFTDKGNLKAFVDIKIGKSLRIMGCRVIQQPNQKAWVSMPQREWKGKEGEARYMPVVELSGDLKEAVEAAILMEWARD